MEYAQKRLPAKSFTDLEVWHEGHKLVLMIYKITRKFPKEELYGLTSQLRRASVSITSNIAEGFGRKSRKDKTAFYVPSAGSITEVQNQIIIARDIKIITNEEFKMIFDQSVSVSKLLNALISKSRTKI